MAEEALVDANVVLRHLTGQPPALAEEAARLLETAEQQRMNLVLAALTVAEVVYVLESVYGWDRTAIADGLLEFLSADVLVVLDGEAVRQALTWYRDVRRVHFADAYVAALAVQRGHGNMITFDRELRRLAGINTITTGTQPRERPPHR